MPNFKLTAQLRDVTTGAAPTQWGLANMAVATAGEHDDRKTVSVGTSEENYAISTDIGNAGLVVIQNKDSTNYVQLGFATGAYYLRLKPGIVYVFELEPTVANLFMKANTAECVVQYHVFEA